MVTTMKRPTNKLPEREGRERRVSDEKHVEVPAQIVVARGRRADAHVGGVSRQKHVPDAARFESVAQHVIAVGVVDDDVPDVDVDIVHDGNRQLPES